MTLALRALGLLVGPAPRAIERRLDPGERVLLLTACHQRRGVIEGGGGERATWSPPGKRVVALTSRRLLAAGRGGIRLELPLAAIRGARIRSGPSGSAVVELRLPHGPLALEGLPGPDGCALVNALQHGLPAAPEVELQLRPRALAGLVPGLLADLAAVLAAPLGLAIWLLALDGVRLDEIGDVGLVGALPATALAALLAMAAAFAVALSRDRLWIGVFHTVVLVIALYGALIPIEEVPSFNVTWRHAGVAKHLAEAGRVDPGIDAYFNWPGFFAVLALATEAAGVRDPLAFASWAPVVANLLYLPPLAMIARSVSDDPRLVPLTLWVFALTNWVGQDYLSPQALHFGLFLVTVAVVLTWFGGRPVAGSWRPRIVRRLRARIASERPAPVPLPRGGRPAVLLVGLAAALAIVPSHQLTPFALLLVLAALLVLGRTWLRGLPLLVAVAIFAWLVFGAITYLAGNIEELRSELGQLQQTIASNVGERVGGSDEHELVVRARLAVTALLLLAAAFAAAHRIRRGRRAWSIVVLLAAPFALPVVQPYGGEIVLRVYLFALPAIAVLVASLVLTAAGPHPWRSGAVVLGLTLALAGSFLVTRYGNARVWLFSGEESAVVDRVYDIAPRGAALVAPATALPWQHRRYAELKHQSLSRIDAPSRGFTDRELVRTILDVVEDKGGGRGYVITTRSTRAYDELFGRATWGSVPGLERALDASPRFRRIVSRRDGKVWVVLPDGSRR